MMSASTDDRKLRKEPEIRESMISSYKQDTTISSINLKKKNVNNVVQIVRKDLADEHDNKIMQLEENMSRMVTDG